MIKSINTLVIIIALYMFTAFGFPSIISSNWSCVGMYRFNKKWKPKNWQKYGWGIENPYTNLCGLGNLKSNHIRNRADSCTSTQFAKKLRDEFFYNKEKQQRAFHVIDSRENYPLSNYKKSIKTIIRFVDESNFSKEIKEKYLNIFFSQFTIHEITVLNYIMELDNEDELKGYFDKYSNLYTKDTSRDSIFCKY